MAVGSAHRTGRFTLTQVAGHNLTEGGKSAPLKITSDRLVLGCAPDADFPVAVGQVAPHHAAIQLVEGAPQVSDLGSESGTFVNFCRIVESTRLSRGDLVSLGREALFLVAYGRAESGATAETDASKTMKIEPVAASAVAAASTQSRQAGRSLGISDEVTVVDTPPSALSAEEFSCPPLAAIAADATAESLPHAGLDTLNALNALQRRISTLQDPKHLLETALEELRRITGAERLIACLRKDPAEEQSAHAGNDHAPKLAVVAAHSAGDSPDAECPGVERIQQIWNSGRGLFGTVPAANGKEARWFIAGTLCGGASPLGIFYGDRPASKGRFGDSEARLLNVVGGCVGVRLVVLQVSHNLVEWSDAYDELYHACRVVLPNLATQLDGDIGRLELIASPEEALPLGEVTRLVREECTQMRKGLEMYLRWLHGGTAAGELGPVLDTVHSTQEDEDQDHAMQLFIDGLVAER